MFDEKLTSIDNIMKTSNICTDSTLPDSSLDSDVSNSVHPNLPTYAPKVLKLPQEVKKFMLDAENEKKKSKKTNKNGELKILPYMEQMK